jgi:hypothetical protein
MGNIIITLLLLILSINVFHTSYVYGLINRTFSRLSPSVIETSIVVIEAIEKQIQPYYDKSLLENNVINFLSQHLFPAIDNYQISFYYFNPETHQICLDLHCQGVRISLASQINIFLEYQRMISYRITQGIKVDD